MPYLTFIKQAASTSYQFNKNRMQIFIFFAESHSSNPRPMHFSVTLLAQETFSSFHKFASETTKKKNKQLLIRRARTREGGRNSCFLSVDYSFKVQLMIDRAMFFFYAKQTGAILNISNRLFSALTHS